MEKGDHTQLPILMEAQSSQQSILFKIQQPKTNEIHRLFIGLQTRLQRPNNGRPTTYHLNDLRLSIGRLIT